MQVSSTELIEAFVDPMNRILEAIHTVLERTPPQLVGDLDKNGIIMSGGGQLPAHGYGQSLYEARP